MFASVIEILRYRSLKHYLITRGYASLIITVFLLPYNTESFTAGRAGWFWLVEHWWYVLGCAATTLALMAIVEWVARRLLFR